MYKFTYHIVNIKPTQPPFQFAGGNLFTYHIVNIKLENDCGFINNKLKFTYHIVNIKLKSKIVPMEINQNLHIT